MGHRSAHAISKRTATNLLRDTHISDAAYADVVYLDSTETIITISAQHDDYDDKLNTLIAEHGSVTLVTSARSRQFQRLL